MDDNEEQYPRFEIWANYLRELIQALAEAEQEALTLRLGMDGFLASEEEHTNEEMDLFVQQLDYIRNLHSVIQDHSRWLNNMIEKLRETGEIP